MGVAKFSGPIFFLVLFSLCVSSLAQVQCTDGTTKKVDCNTCYCEKGEWICTLMGCIHDDDVSSTTSTTPEIDWLEECTDGETRPLDCNTCFCDGGHWACTLMGCGPIIHVSESSPLRTRRDTEASDCSDEDAAFSKNETHYCFCYGNQRECNEIGSECQPGETKKQDCNNCFCSEVGYWACTLMLCPDENVQPVSYSSPVNQGEDECTEGDTKMLDCNHCFCSRGLWGCTLMGCGGFHVTEASSSRKRRDAEALDCTDENSSFTKNETHYCICYGDEIKCNELGNECQPGETKKDECNNCFCSEVGYWACTLMLCQTEDVGVRKTDVIEIKDECNEGETRMLDCNTCICYNGRLACTLMACEAFHDQEDSSSRKRREAEASDCSDGDAAFSKNETHYCFCYGNQRECNEIGNECQLGDTKKEDCNNCFCSEVGYWACTRRLCPDENVQPVSYSSTVNQGGDECKEGDTKMLDCNHCFCSGGLWGCTLMGCDGFHVTEASFSRKRRDADALDCTDKNSSFTKNETHYCICYGDEIQCNELGNECQPGETKKDECNNCFCSEVGYWACTLMLCQTEDVGVRKTDVIEIKDECNDGDTKMLDCNTCTCFNGHYACTLMGCDGFHKQEDSSSRKRREAETLDCTDENSSFTKNETHYCICYGDEIRCNELGNECQPGETKKDECNNCFCSGVGYWACTLMLCQTEDVGVRRTDVITIKDECNEGDTKMLDCNTCSCYNGHYACTLMGCEAFHEQENSSSRKRREGKYEESNGNGEPVKFY